MRNVANHSVAISIHDESAAESNGPSSSTDDEGHPSTTSTSYLQLPSWMLAILRTAVSRDERPTHGQSALPTRHRHATAVHLPDGHSSSPSTSAPRASHHDAPPGARRGGRLQVTPNAAASEDGLAIDAVPLGRASPGRLGTDGVLDDESARDWDASIVTGSDSNHAAAAVATVAGAPADDQTAAAAAEPPSTAAAAELHRMQDSATITVQSVTSWVEHTAPFWLLIAFVFGYQYFSGVLIVVWLLGALLQSNASLRKQVALKSNWQPLEVIHMTCYILATLFLASWAAASIHPWRYLALWPPSTSLTVPEAFFVVLVVDMLARFLGMLPKIGVLLFCQLRPGGGTGRALRQQGRMLTALEHAALLYHTLLPIGPWYTCFLKAVPHPLMASTLAGVYLTLKGHSVVQRVKLVVLATRMVSRRGAVYGTYAGREDIEAAGGCCPICQDPIATGVRLECGHVFCEEDIAEWLERERTCPMCRADVKPPGMTSYSDGGSSILPLLF